MVDILTYDNRIAETDGIDLEIILGQLKEKEGKVIHNSFLEDLEKDILEDILYHPVRTECLNYLAN